MQDHQKTKAQLIEELQELRSRLAVLETKSPDTEKPLSSRLQREELPTTIQFIGDFGLVQAQGIDWSEGGIGFELPEPIFFDMAFAFEGKTHHHRAQLVWMKTLANGRYCFGFQFVPVESSVLLHLFQELENSDP